MVNFFGVGWGYATPFEPAAAFEGSCRARGVGAFGVGRATVTCSGRGGHPSAAGQGGEPGDEGGGGFKFNSGLSTGSNMTGMRGGGKLAVQLREVDTETIHLAIRNDLFVDVLVEEPVQLVTRPFVVPEVFSWIFEFLEISLPADVTVKRKESTQSGFARWSGRCWMGLVAEADALGGLQWESPQFSTAVKIEAQIGVEEIDTALLRGVVQAGPKVLPFGLPVRGINSG